MGTDAVPHVWCLQRVRSGSFRCRSTVSWSAMRPRSLAATRSRGSCPLSARLPRVRPAFDCDAARPSETAAAMRLTVGRCLLLMLRNALGALHRDPQLAVTVRPLCHSVRLCFSLRRSRCAAGSMAAATRCTTFRTATGGCHFDCCRRVDLQSCRLTLFR